MTLKIRYEKSNQAPFASWNFVFQLESFFVILFFIVQFLVPPAANAAPSKLCRNYFVHVDLLESFTDEEKINLLTLAEKYRDSKQHPHDSTVDVKILIDANLKLFIKNKNFNTSQSKDFRTLFLRLVRELQERRDDKDDRIFAEKKTAAQLLLLQQTLKHQELSKYIRLLKKYQVDDFEALLKKIFESYQTQDLHEAFLRSCGKKFLKNKVYQADILEIQYLLELQVNMQLNINLADAEGQTALVYASAHGNKESVQLLIQAGLDVNNWNHSDAIGSRPLIVALKHYNLYVVEALIGAGADVNLSDKLQNKALITALARLCNLHARQLVAAGADVNSQNKGAYTPLHMAIRLKNTEMVRFLLEAGASTKAISMTDVAPLSMAATLDDPAIVRLLLEAGAQVNAQDAEGITALMYAADYSRLQNVQILLEANADASLRTSKDMTALFLAQTTKYNKSVSSFKKWKAEQKKIIQILKMKTPSEPFTLGSVWKSILRKFSR